MSIDIAALVAPLSDDAPSGPDLSYESGRQQIEGAFERSISAEASGDDVTDWRATIDLILAEAETTRDLWLSTYLMRAAANVGQFDLVVDGSELLATLLEERWADVHPQLDEVGFLGRKTPCESLTRIGEFLGPLANVPLIEHPRFGKFSGADFERFHEEGDGADGYGPFRAAVDAAGAEDLLTVVDRLDAVRQAIRRADAVLTANADGDTGTNFKPTYDAIEKLRRAVAHYLPGGAVSAEGSDEDAGSQMDDIDGGAAQVSGGGVGAIRSRDDVIRALDLIAAYYARHEPGSPVPFVLRRARDWTSLDFLSVLEDIAPDSLDSARRVLVNGRDQYSNSNGSSSADDGWSS